MTLSYVRRNERLYIIIIIIIIIIKILTKKISAVIKKMCIASDRRLV